MAASEDLEAFRAEFRDWFEENCPQEMRDGVMNEKTICWGGKNWQFTSDAQRAWLERAAAKGYTVPTWPVEYGGAGLNRDQEKIFYEEMARIKARRPLQSFGIWMLGPALLHFGSHEQKLHYLPPIARGEVRWCQGYSEPGAGSDLASVQTRGEDKGDHWLVNGQKTWTSGGQWADWCFALVRTDTSKKHEGISFILLDMKSPGVEVKPIRMISGTSPFCETFFTDVKVPKENLVGEPGNGWTIGKRLLQHERTNLSGGGSLGRGQGPSLSDIAKHYVGTDAEGRIADADLRMRIVRHEMEAQAFKATARRVMLESKSGNISLGSSILKNVGARITQERAELTLEIMGMNGLGWSGEGFNPAELGATRGWLWGKAVSIYGGTTEIQNNVIAKRILGMLDHQ